MTRVISQDDMANVRQSLAQAGIFFDKLYINQAYFNSNFTIQTSTDKPKKSNQFWHKLFCASKTKRSTIATQTALTVRDDYELKRTPTLRRPRIPPAENAYDRRRCRPLHRESTHNNYQQPIRRRRSSFVTRSVQFPQQKATHKHDADDDDDDENSEFAV